MTSSDCLQAKCEKLAVKYVFLSYSTLVTDCSLKESISFTLHPDPSTFIQLPWNKELAWVQCNLSKDGVAYEQCPRRTLLRVVEEAKKNGLVFKSGIEPEFFITNKEGTLVHDAIHALPLHEPGAIHRNLPLLTEIFDGMEKLGWKPYQIFHEASDSQYEINFDYDDVIKTADRLCFFKFMAKQLAVKHGVRITFMPVPFLNHICASGMHINMSVWDVMGEKNLLLSRTKLFKSPGIVDNDDSGDDDDDVTPTTKYFVGGLLKYVREYCAVLCSTVNSYKRLNQGSWCPTNVSWGRDDKKVLVRLSTKERIEHRLSDAATNPHLAHAVLVACGLEGIVNRIEPPKDSWGKSKEKTLPQALNEALREFEASVSMRKWLGAALVEDYAALKRSEWKKYSQELTKWEMQQYIDC